MVFWLGQAFAKHLLLVVQCFFIEYLLALASALKFSMLT
jgi:hypothetical protein